MSLRRLNPNIMDIAQGALNVEIKTHLDDLLIKIMGDEWADFKRRRVISKANKYIRKMEMMADK